MFPLMSAHTGIRKTRHSHGKNNAFKVLSVTLLIPSGKTTISQCALGHGGQGQPTQICLNRAAISSSQLHIRYVIEVLHYTFLVAIFEAALIGF